MFFRLTNKAWSNFLIKRASNAAAENYSTSFATAIRFLHEDIRADVCNIYGFVRFADEIVDTFHNYNKEELLRSFEKKHEKRLRKK